MMKITGLSHLFKWENLHNRWLTKYFFAPLYIYRTVLSFNEQISQIMQSGVLPFFKTITLKILHWQIKALEASKTPSNNHPEHLSTVVVTFA